MNGTAPTPVLTLLYVPADRPDRVVKALASAADVVVVDLEDAVAAGHKDAARASLAEVLVGATRPVQVRVNAVGSPWFTADVQAVRTLGSSIGIRVPKVSDPDGVRALSAIRRPLHLLLESALGLERAYELATASPAVSSIGLGEADLRSDLGIVGEPGMTWARSRLVVAARAAGLPAPAMSVYPNVRDLEGLAESCALGRSLGMLGRAAIHPAQLPVIEKAFLPSREQLARAREVVERVGEATADGAGTVVLDDGTFLDVAMVDAARRTLALADRAESAG
ncbi:HpcH/HpaI aldolase/citrate lyase family protein [Pseudactinotalea suaedae]|uniref:HpcH/HpaI aldolase/citrate lyase family protein n=1 Tax=Pseudactinotalea suaedae TaxID=1524924 RepID=UPI0012E2A36D|nr:CoA ester lyase [Pseudactinotalea suaedae]